MAVVHHEQSARRNGSPFLCTRRRVPRRWGVYRGTQFPNSERTTFVVGLRGERIIRVALDGRRVLLGELLEKKYGRIRDVAEGRRLSVFFHFKPRRPRFSSN